MVMVKQMEKKLILLDIDGTIVDNKNRVIPESTITALKKLKENNHELVIATGRAYFMLYTIEDIKSLIDHYILINGQHIISHDKTIYEDTVDIFDINKLIHSMKDKNIVYGFQSAFEEAISEINESSLRAFEDLNLNVPPQNKDFHEKVKVHQMWCFCTPEEVEQLRIENPEFDFIKWTTVGYDIIKKGKSKGKAVDILVDLLDFDINDVIAIGDGDNDIEMLEKANIGIAMGNATDNLKEVADIITEDIYSDGFYKAFEKLGLI